ncbi:MAG: hypothetical protein JST83_03960 [Bacteroidetes bacterium]|nr:hypothetical protein [Bacteroidota bacterium]
MSITAKLIQGITTMSEMKIRYKDGKEIKSYTIEPHLLGKFKSTGNIVLSAHDVTDRVNASWKSFIVQNILSADATCKCFDNPAPNYNPQDKRMETIIASITTEIEE